ncbi:hypothetical protein [Ensifer sp. ENS12]|jgi:hypothetical protein|uniref:hypothetical protein n=1 Tax=Ensifer sp. ENS12 TaxID=2854774 RepID=UPI0013AFE22B|nr:hypothetical protein [Ensifer sp. ENS12]MBV7516379.1 hypothetical protein [Ensifer sp. ENS12]
MFLDNLKRFRANKRRRRIGRCFSQAKENRALMASRRAAAQTGRHRSPQLTMSMLDMYGPTFTID